MSTFVSVIVPVYNIEEYIERCVNSILLQTYENFELLLVDDGSTDASGKIIDELAKKDSRIIVFHKENGGSSSARNLAIENAKGEYLCFVDSDDYVSADYLESLVLPVNRAKEEGSDIPMIVQVGRDEIDANGNRLPDICIPPVTETFIPSKQFFETLIMHIGDCSFCTKLTSRTLFDNLSFPIGKLNEDFNLLVNMLPNIPGIVSMPGYKYHVFYRIGSNSRKKDVNDFSRVFQDCVDNADMIEQIVANRYPELKEIAIRFALFQRLEYLLHIPVTLMRKDYEGYPECVSYIRKHFGRMLTNRYLTVKNKIYLTLFSIAPKGVRIVHRKLKKIN